MAMMLFSVHMSMDDAWNRSSDCDRQGEAEGRALARLTFAGNRAAVGRDDFMDDGQSQAGTASSALSGNTEELLENMRQMLGWNADAGVRHRQDHGFRRGRRGKG